MNSVVSFDVFDTLLVRAVLPPATVFQLVAVRLRDDGVADVDPVTFLRARRHAEEALVAEQGGPDARVGLAEITARLCDGLGLDRALAPRLADTELAVEDAVCRPNPPARRLLEAARARGHRVVFATDMYVPGTFVERVLSAHGLWQEGDRIYASAEHGASKQTGRLFDLIAAREGCPPSALTHVGDSPGADVRRPRARGVRVVHLRDAAPTRYERLLAGAEPAAGGLGGVLAGAARLARLGARPVTPTEHAFVDVVTGVAAPTLIAFVSWCRQQARRHGARRLLFVSRDGQVLAALARRLAPDADVRYLYGGRAPWCLAAAGGAAVDEAWVWDPTTGLRARDVLDRLGVDPADVQGAGGIDWAAPLDGPGRQRLAEILHRPANRALVEQAAAEPRRLAVAYLRQEGVLDDEATAIVDIGWSGTVYRAFRRLVTAEGAPPPLGLYFDLVAPSPGCAAFLSAPDVRRRLPGLLGGVATLMEAFTAADHGTVLGYERAGGRVRPVLAAPDAPGHTVWGLADLRRLVAATCDEFCDRDLPAGTPALQHAVVDALRTLWTRPTAAEAAAFAAFLFEDGMGGGTVRRPLAAPYTGRDLVPALTTRHGARRHRHEWQAGSLALTPPALRAPLTAAAELRRAAWRLARLTR